MARRSENECAFCAEEIAAKKEIIGRDWKVYCSESCAEAGEVMSREEWRKVMRVVTARNDLFIREQTVRGLAE